ncbi:MAG: glycosyltransferase [Oligosphaeraceae bacterium]
MTAGCAASQAPRVGVVVVSYRSPQRTCAFVREELPRLPFPWVACVVEVASLPETRQALETGLPQETLFLSSQENLGYSRGNNWGAEELRRRFPSLEYLLIANDDIQIPRDHRLETLLDALDAHPEWGVAGPDVRGLDDFPQSPWNTAADLGDERSPAFPPTASPFGGDARECYGVRGCFMLVRADAFFQAGGFDADYFLFFEEPALGERLRRMGLSTVYLPHARVIHWGSATIRKALSSWKIYLLYRKSFLLTARKYWGWGWLRRFTWPLRQLFRRLLGKRG